MKRNDIKKLHSTDLVDLRKQERELIESIAKARLEKTVGKLPNRKQLRTLSVDLARVKTVITEQEMKA
jgi:ribosomal protein L29